MDFDIEEEFEIKRQALQMMENRLNSECQAFENEVMQLSLSISEKLAPQLQASQTKLSSLAAEAEKASASQEAILGNLQNDVENALAQCEQSLASFEQMKAERQDNVAAFKKKIRDAGFEVSQQSSETRKALGNLKDQMINFIREKGMEARANISSKTQEVANALRPQF